MVEQGDLEKLFSFTITGAQWREKNETSLGLTPAPTFLYSDIPRWENKFAMTRETLLASTRDNGYLLFLAVGPSWLGLPGLTTN